MLLQFVLYALLANKLGGCTKQIPCNYKDNLSADQMGGKGWLIIKKKKKGNMSLIGCES